MDGGGMFHFTRGDSRPASGLPRAEFIKPFRLKYTSARTVEFETHLHITIWLKAIFIIALGNAQGYKMHQSIRSIHKGCKKANLCIERNREMIIK